MSKIKYKYAVACEFTYTNGDIHTVLVKGFIGKPLNEQRGFDTEKEALDFYNMYYASEDNRKFLEVVRYPVIYNYDAVEITTNNIWFIDDETFIGNYQEINYKKYTLYSLKDNGMFDKKLIKEFDIKFNYNLDNYFIIRDNNEEIVPINFKERYETNAIKDILCSLQNKFNCVIKEPRNYVTRYLNYNNDTEDNFVNEYKKLRSKGI